MSRLPTKDLTRALTVSKHWQKSILGSVVLRRNLFLDPEPITEYLTSEREGLDVALWMIFTQGRYLSNDGGTLVRSSQTDTKFE